MPRVQTRFPADWSIEDLLKDLGNIAPCRVRLKPMPGTATEKDVLRIEQKEGRLYELVDGVLVEKVMGARESYVSMRLGHFIQSYLDEHDLGYVTGEAGTLRLLEALVRIPDLGFVAWDQLPTNEVPEDAILDMAPALAVEVLSKSNTKNEMKRKLKEYFLAGVQLVWFVDPATQTVEVFTAPDQSTLVQREETLEGGTVLPGFALPLHKLFDRLSKTPRKTAKPSRRKPKK